MFGGECVVVLLGLPWRLMYTLKLSKHNIVKNQSVNINVTFVFYQFVND